MAGAERWVRRFSVGEARPHRRGFTLYNITSYLFPRTSPEAITVVTVWKRYSDLQKLQQKMKKMHQELYLKGTCPNFEKWGYFKRFEPEVIEERIRSTQAILEFIALHPPLFTSSEFVKFFQTSHPDPNADVKSNPPGNIETIRNSLLLPTEPIAPLDYQSSEEDSFSIIDSPISPTDTISVDSSIVIKQNTSQSAINKHSTKSTKLLSNGQNNETNQNGTDLMNIPCSSVNNNNLHPNGEPSCSISNNNNYKNQSLSLFNSPNNLNLPDLISFGSFNMETSQISIESSDSLGSMNTSLVTKNGDFTKDEIASDTLSERWESSGESQTPAYYGSVPQSDTDQTISSSQSVKSYFSGQIASNEKNNNSVNQVQSINERSNSIEPIKDVPHIAHKKHSTASVKGDIGDVITQNNVNNTRPPSRLDCISMDSSFSSCIDIQENYVFEAGYLLSLGARNESKGEYLKAFDCYKSAIEKMLIGVQGDSNELRRQFVKDKITRYLSHAEKIYTTYLNDQNNEMPDDNSTLPNEPLKPKAQSIKHCDASNLCKPYNELSKYRVLGIIEGQVLFVLSSDTQECYAMKVVQKTCNQISDDEYFLKGSIDNKLPTLPINIPYVVKLISYIETSNLLFLVLQYVSGGKLFDYINNHAKTVPNTPAREVNLENVFIDPANMKTPFIAMQDSFRIQDIVDSIEFQDAKIKKEQIDRLNDETPNKNDFMEKMSKLEIKNTLKTDNNTKFDSDLDISVNDIVINSQRLLLNVDNVLSGNFSDKKDDIKKKDLSNDSLFINTYENNKKGKLSLMVTEVEEAFDGFQEKLEKIVGDQNQKNTLSKKCALPPKAICKWGAELLTAIDHLHQHGVICRTLNPDNLLLGDRGHLMVSYIIGRNSQDFIVPLLNNMNTGRSYDVYIAPELQQFFFPREDDGKIDERVCDFWSFGALMYDLIIGTPLSLTHPTGINSHTIINFPEDLSHDAESLLIQLLCFNPRERLGSGPSGIDEIKSHSYFKHIDWSIIEEDFIHDNK